MVVNCVFAQNCSVLETVNNSRALEDVEKINLMNSTKDLN